MRLCLCLLFAVLAESAQAHMLRVPADFNSLTAALKMYKLNLGHYPSGAEGFRALVERPPDLPPNARWTQLMDRVPLDPWGNEYGYLEGSGFPDTFGLYSKGPDGVSSTQGNDPDDVNSWSDNISERPSLPTRLASNFHGREFLIALPSALLGAALAMFWRKKRDPKSAVP